MVSISTLLYELVQSDGNGARHSSLEGTLRTARIEEFLLDVGAGHVREGRPLVEVIVLLFDHICATHAKGNSSTILLEAGDAFLNYLALRDSWREKLATGERGSRGNITFPAPTAVDHALSKLAFNAFEAG